jgi:hypothetical protein
MKNRCRATLFGYLDHPRQFEEMQNRAIKSRRRTGDFRECFFDGLPECGLSSGSSKVRPSTMTGAGDF